MGNFFPRWTNILPIKLVIAVFVIATAAVAAISTYWTPKYSRVGYQPEQPISFDHSIHAGQLGMDCRYCHTFVESSSHSNIPTAQTCWNCHQYILKEDPRLETLREAMDTSWDGYTGEAIEWVQIHRVPEYAYFNHQVHVNRGVSCVSCHGKVNEMEVVYQHESQSMGWCLDCHRAPENALRPLDEITNLDWKAEDLGRDDFYAYLADKAHSEVAGLKEEASRRGFDVDGPLTQKEVGTMLKEAWGINPPQSCYGCHR